MDALTATTVIVFVAIIFYVLLVFSLAYYIAFGPDLESYKGYSTTMYVLFSPVITRLAWRCSKHYSETGITILWKIPTKSLVQCCSWVSFVVLKITCAVFFVFVSLVLMNLLIGVLGQAYEEAQGLNEKRWNRFITNLMILVTCKIFA